MARPVVPQGKTFLSLMVFDGRTDSDPEVAVVGIEIIQCVADVVVIALGNSKLKKAV